MPKVTKDREDKVRESYTMKQTHYESLTITNNACYKKFYIYIDTLIENKNGM